MRAHPAPERTARDVASTFATLAAYVGALAVLALAVPHVFRWLVADASTWAPPYLPTF